MIEIGPNLTLLILWMAIVTAMTAAFMWDRR